MGFLDFLNNLFPVRHTHHEHNWIQFSKTYRAGRHYEFKQRCDRCYRVRYVGSGHDPVERFTSLEAINDEILGFMRHAFKR